MMQHTEFAPEIQHVSRGAGVEAERERNIDTDDAAIVMRYAVPEASQGEQAAVRPLLYDIPGREIATLVEGLHSPGYRSLAREAGGSLSGVTFCRMEGESFTDTKNLVPLGTGPEDAVSSAG